MERAGGLLTLLEGRTGANVRSVGGLRDSRYAVSIANNIVYGQNTGPWCYDAAEDRIVWQVTGERHRESAGCFGVGCETIVNGAPDGTVRGIELGTGRERWTTSVADLSTSLPTLGRIQSGRPASPFSVHSDSAVFLVGGGYAVSVSLDSGARRWVLKTSVPAEEAFLYGAHYHILLEGGLLQVVAAETGSVEAQYSLQRELSSSLPGVAIGPPLLVTEDHYWVGSREGYLLAFDRRAGPLSWAFRPNGGGDTAVYLNGITASNDWLLYCDASNRVYCLGSELGGEARDVPNR